MKFIRDPRTCGAQGLATLLSHQKKNQLTEKTKETGNSMS